MQLHEHFQQRTVHSQYFSVVTVVKLMFRVRIKIYYYYSNLKLNTSLSIMFSLLILVPVVVCYTQRSWLQMEVYLSLSAFQIKRFV